MVLDSLLRVSQELFDLLINDLADFRVEFDAELEESNEVDKSSNRHNGDVSEVLEKSLDMSDHELRHDLQDHLRFELFASALGRHEKKSFMEELNASLFLSDSSHFFNFLVFSVHILEDSVLDLKSIILSEVKGKPMGELIIRERVSDFMLDESAHTEQIHSRIDKSDLSCSGQPVK